MLEALTAIQFWVVTTLLSVPQSSVDDLVGWGHHGRYDIHRALQQLLELGLVDGHKLGQTRRRQSRWRPSGTSSHSRCRKLACRT